MTQTPIATLILNRNLPEVTDKLVNHFKKWDGDVTDIYVIESGSDADKLSKHCSFWANWPEAKEKGLRWARGFNYGLMELDKTGKRYEYYFLVMGDSIFAEQPSLKIMQKIMDQHPKVGILSPLSPAWGMDKNFLGNEDLKLFWLVTHVSWMVRRGLIDALKPTEDPSYMNYLYDGTNFRGYYDDIELTARGYQAGYATAVTPRVIFHEQADLTKLNADKMKTDQQFLHWRLMHEEGLEWMRKKYGFRNKGQFKVWARQVYDDFMAKNPEESRLKA